ncbi:MAG: carbohydrate ABC transporter permease [Lachnospiraceae bacterium]|nr:carbohydrate ABC transporter permease [Lachnospiraceae bacterium]
MTRKERREYFKERNRKSGGYLLRKRIWNFIFRFCRAVLIFGLCFLILQPLLNKISLCFMTKDDLFDRTVISIPRHFSTQAIRLGWKLMYHFKPFWYSIWIGVLVGVIQVISSTLVGYGFARFKFPLKNFWFACVILMIIVPPQTLLTPMYLMFSDFDIFGIIRSVHGGKGINLLGSFWAYLAVCAGCAGYKSGLYIYMMRQHFRNEPKELEEAAWVDGCGKFRTFWNILLPGARPMMVSCFLFAFVWWWTDGIYSKIFFARGMGWYTVANCLPGVVERLNHEYKQIFNIVSSSGGNFVPPAYGNQILSAATMITLVPLIIIYLLAQKSFVESISQSGIKG